MTETVDKTVERGGGGGWGLGVWGACGQGGGVGRECRSQGMVGLGSRGWWGKGLRVKVLRLANTLDAT